MAEPSRMTTAQKSVGNAPVDENWCHTRMVVSKHCYRWIIHDFCSHGEKMGGTLESSTFSTGTDGKLTWRLELFRDCRYDDLRNRIPTFLVGLRLASCQLSHVDVDCCVSVLDSKGGKTATKYLKSRFYPSNKAAVKLSGESGQYFDVSDAVSPDDTVTIRCEMDVFVGPVNVPGENKAIAVPERQLSSDLGQLFEDGKYSDVVLNVQGQEIRAHKMILSARSVVFASMFEERKTNIFEYDMEKRKTNLVKITDLDYETMKQTVRFMYTDQAPDIDAKAEDLLAAADKYGLGRLKALCEKALSSKVCAETAATLLFLADMHSADQLKRLVMDFVKTRVKDVMVTSGWKMLTQRRPQLIDEVFRAFAIERCLRETCQQDG